MLLGAATLLSWAIQLGACWGNWAGRRGRLGLVAFLLAQPFMEAREKKAAGTCPRGKQLKATPPSPVIHLSIHCSHPVLL